MTEGGGNGGGVLIKNLRHGTWGPTTQSPILCSSMWKMAGEPEEAVEVEGKEEEEEGGHKEWGEGRGSSDN